MICVRYFSIYEDDLATQGAGNSSDFQMTHIADPLTFKYDRLQPAGV